MNLVMPVGPGRHRLAAFVLEQHRILHPELDPVVICNRETFRLLALETAVPPKWFDEDVDLKGLTLDGVRALLPEGEKFIAGWYFQQFTKFQAAVVLPPQEHYVVWDSDTIPLRRIEFFREGRPVFSVKTEHHEAYFLFTKKVLGMEKLRDHSYISEYMVLKTELVRELLDRFQQLNHQRPWYENVMQAIDPYYYTRAGFSEFETYGTYVDHRCPDDYGRVRYRILRDSRRTYGQRPNRYDLAFLRKRWDIATFENHQPIRRREVAIAKTRAFFGSFLGPSLSGAPD